MNSEEQSIVADALRILEKQLKRGRAITSPEYAMKFCRLQLGGLQRETFAVIYLDTRHRLIYFDALFAGTVDGATVYPREIVRGCIEHNASAVMLAHNHPSGVCEPSAADEALTKRIKTALALIDVRVLDHIVVSPSGALSLSELGKM